LDLSQVQRAAEVILDAYWQERLICIAGNGGSASMASHFVNDLNKGILGHKGDRNIRRFKAMALNDNVSLMTAWANDLGYNHIFSEQVKNYMNSGDLIILISSSGNSPNLVMAAKEARARGVKVLSMTAFSGGELKNISDAHVYIPIDSYQISEDIHLVLAHILSSYFYENLDERNNKQRNSGKMTAVKLIGRQFLVSNL